MQQMFNVCYIRSCTAYRSNSRSNCMDKKKEKQSVVQLIRGFMQRANGDHVGAYAAQAAYFLIMSFIPFILFLTTMIRYTPLTYNMVSEAIRAFVPHNIQNFVLTIVSEVYGRSTAVVPISAIMALWSAGKAMQSLTNGLNTIYHVKETRNWLMTRLYAVVYTFMFSVAIIASLLLLVLGNQIQAMALKYIPFVGKIIGKVIGARTALVFAQPQGNLQKPGAGSGADRSGMVLVFLFLFPVFRAVSRLQQYVRKPDGTDHGNAVAVHLHEPAFVRCGDQFLL